MTSLILRNGSIGRNSRNWSAFEEFDNLVDRILNSYQPGLASESAAQMPVELVESDNNLILKAILPGLKKEDINIEVSENQVSITGEYKSEYEEDKDQIHRSEFFAGKFARTVSLPQKIDHQKAKAEYREGILILTLPKSEKELNKVIKLSL